MRSCCRTRTKRNSEFVRIDRRKTVIPAFTIPLRAKRHTALADGKQTIEDAPDERETIASETVGPAKK